MLPFMKKNIRQAGVIVEQRKPDEKPEEKQEHNELHVVAKDLLDAIEVSDLKKIAAALRAAHDICDAMPHEEGEHEESDGSYDSQNVLAKR